MCLLAESRGGRRCSGFVAVVDQVITLLRQRGRVAYHTLKRQFQRNDEAIENLTIALIDAQPLARLSHWDGPLSAGNLPDKAWWPQGVTSRDGPDVLAAADGSSVGAGGRAMTREEGSRAAP